MSQEKPFGETIVQIAEIDNLQEKSSRLYNEMVTSDAFKRVMAETKLILPQKHLPIQKASMTLQELHDEISSLENQRKSLKIPETIEKLRTEVEERAAQHRANYGEIHISALTESQQTESVGIILRPPPSADTYEKLISDKKGPFLEALKNERKIITINQIDPIQINTIAENRRAAGRYKSTNEASIEMHSVVEMQELLSSMGLDINLEEGEWLESKRVYGGNSAVAGKQALVPDCEYNIIPNLNDGPVYVRLYENDNIRVIINTRTITSSKPGEFLLVIKRISDIVNNSEGAIQEIKITKNEDSTGILKTTTVTTVDLLPQGKNIKKQILKSISINNRDSKIRLTESEHFFDSRNELEKAKELAIAELNKIRQKGTKYFEELRTKNSNLPTLHGRIRSKIESIALLFIKSPTEFATAIGITMLKEIN